MPDEVAHDYAPPSGVGDDLAGTVDDALGLRTCWLTAPALPTLTARFEHSYARVLDVARNSMKKREPGYRSCSAAGGIYCSSRNRWATMSSLELFPWI